MFDLELYIELRRIKQKLIAEKMVTWHLLTEMRRQKIDDGGNVVHRLSELDKQLFRVEAELREVKE